MLISSKYFTEVRVKNNAQLVQRKETAGKMNVYYLNCKRKGTHAEIIFFECTEDRDSADSSFNNAFIHRDMTQAQDKFDLCK